jgi:hypothetical protein
MSPIVYDPALDGDTLGQLKQELFDRGFDYLDSTTDSRALRFINGGIDKVCEAERWPFLHATITCASGDQLGPLLAIEEVRYGTVELLGTTRKALRGDRVDLDLEGVPTHFYIESDDTLRTWPVCTTEDLVVECWQGPLPLSEDDDMCVIPRRFSYVILDAAVREAEKDRHNWTAVAQLKTDFEDGIATMRDSLLGQQQSDPEVIGHAGDDWA